MGMAGPVPTFTHLVSCLPADLAYLSVVESRIADGYDYQEDDPVAHTNDFLRKLWAPRPLISAGGYNRQLGLEVAERSRTGELIAYGRLFISNVGVLPRFIPYR